MKKSEQHGERAAVAKKAATSKTKDSAPSPDSSQKVVIRYADGRVVRGFVPKRGEGSLVDKLPDPLTVKEPDGKRVKVIASDIKAIFFVRSFEGNQDYTEFKVFSGRPSGKGVWVRLDFKDGETIEGVAPNSLETYSNPLFYLTPPDPRSNNQGVLVSKHYLKDMQVLGLATD